MNPNDKKRDAPRKAPDVRNAAPGESGGVRRGGRERPPSDSLPRSERHQDAYGANPAAGNVGAGRPSASRGTRPDNPSRMGERGRNRRGAEPRRQRPANGETYQKRNAGGDPVGSGGFFAVAGRLGGRVRRAADRLPAGAAAAGARFLASFLCGMLFSRAPMLFSALPLGLALLSSVEGTMPLCAVGVFVGSLSGGAGTVYAASAVLIAAARLLLSLFGREREPNGKGLFSDSLRVRLYLAALSAFGVGIYRIIVNGYRYYDLFGCFFLLFAVPGATVLFSLLFSGQAARRGSLQRLCIAVFCAALIFSLRGLSPFGMDFASLAAAFFTLFFARETGMLPGTAVGLLFGLAAAPMAAPAFAVMGLIAGLMQRASLSLTVIASSAAACCMELLVFGVQEFLSLLPETVASAVLCVLTERTPLMPAISSLFYTAEEEKTAVDNVPVRTEDRLAALSESFRSLSEVCYALSDRYRRPDELELRALCDRVCDRYCARCRVSPLCWNREYSSTSDVMNGVVNSLSEGKRVTRGSVPTYFSVRCPSVDGILKEINDGCAALTEQRLRGDKSEIFAMDYEATAALIREALESGRREYAPDRKLAAACAKRCAELFGAGGVVTVRGARHKSVRGSGFPVSPVMPPDRLRSVLEETLHCRLSVPVCETEGGKLSFTAHSIRRFSAQVAFLCRPKEGDGECGDSVSAFENREDYFYTMLSDGMGSGSEAALTSSVCAVFLKKMLYAGNAKETSIEMLNNLVRSSSDEISATVDLFELDLISGKASFIKSGAAPSFVRRGGRLFRIQSKTLPIGIVRAAAAEQVSFTAEDGDCIIMQSDGVAESYEDSPWLAHLITRSWDGNLRAMCTRILDAAEENNPKKDDRSVAIIRIRKE